MIKPMTTRLIRRARDITNAAYALRHDLYRSLGPIGVHRNYTRFIILGRSRSGSNFLRGLMNSHSNVVTFGELFASDASLQWGLFGYPTSPKVLAQFRNAPTDFLDSHVYGEVPRHIHAVGFKLFYYHARNEKWQSIWEYVAAQPDLKVIHLMRGNLLKLHLSQKKALLTERWVNVSGAPEESPPITLDYDECLRDFQRTKKWEREGAQFFAKHALLEVQYEALVRDQAVEMARVQEFLGVKPEKLRPQTYKQSDKPLSEAIRNYQELKEQFRGTEWEVYFEE